MNQNWMVELWKGDDALEISGEAKEILEKVLSGPPETRPEFVKVSGEMIAIKNIARIRRSKNW